MAQTNYTPISLYYSTTASAIPTAANLVPGELAINTADGKLYYEDSSGVVQVLATKSTGSIGGSNTQVQFNNSGSLGGSSGLTWDGSFLTTSSIKNSALTSGRVTYAGASGLLSDSANLNFTGSFLNIGGSTVTDNHLLNIQGSNVSNNIGFTLNKTNGTPKIFGLEISGANALNVYDYSASSTRFVIDTNGNVGIGTTTIPGKLTSAVADNATYQLAGCFTNLINADFLINIKTSSVEIGSSVGIPLCFATSATERMRIDSSGNLLVGKTATDVTTAGTQLESTGTVGITRDSATNLILNRKTSDGTIVSIRRDNTEVGSISATTTLTSYNVTSDERLKTNIVDAPLGNIDSIKVRSFDWIINGSHQEYGMVAQELIEVAPYAVTKTENPDDMMQVDYSKLVPMMIKEIQDLKQRIATLENK
jgi:hypothetical protein